MVGSIGVFAINAALYPKLPSDPTRDLEPLTLAVVTPNVLVAGSKFPADDVKSLVAYAKKNPGRLSYASSGTGSSDHLSAELLKLQTDTFGVHIPYRGGAAAMADLIGGNVDVSLQNLGAAMGHIKAGRLKALGVTSDSRHPQLPDVPTGVEQGLPGFVVTSWQAFMAPRGLPPEIRGRLHAELVAALTASDVRERFATQGFDVVAGTPEQFAAFQREEMRAGRRSSSRRASRPTEARLIPATAPSPRTRAPRCPPSSSPNPSIPTASRCCARGPASRSSRARPSRPTRCAPPRRGPTRCWCASTAATSRSSSARRRSASSRDTASAWT
jgi:tripartite-type tricarboxylate transporter receptor subunit TctC